MSVRHLVVAALLVAAGAAQAQSLPGGTVQVPAPAPLVLNPQPASLPPAAPKAADVAEPSSLALLLAGVIGAGALRRRRLK